MNAEETKDFIDLGSDPVDDEFDPFASDGDLDEAPADTSDTEQAEESAGIPASGNPLEKAIGKAEDKAAEKAKAGLLEKMPVFEYAGASEDIADASKTFDELRVEKSEDFPELSDGKRVSWTVEYGKITRSVPNPKAVRQLVTGSFTANDILVPDLGLWRFPAGAFHGQAGGPC